MRKTTNVANALNGTKWRRWGKLALVLFIVEAICTGLIGFGPVQLAYVQCVNGLGWLHGHVSNPVAMYHRAHLHGKLPDSRVVSAGNALGRKLLHEFTTSEPARNVFFSPYSAAAAMSMANNGADGKTEAEMADVLGLKGLSLDEIDTANARLLERMNYADPMVQISVANSLWADNKYPLRKEYIERLERGFDARAVNLDLQSPGAPA